MPVRRNLFGLLSTIYLNSVFIIKLFYNLLPFYLNVK